MFDGYSWELDLYLNKPEVWSALLSNLQFFKPVGELRGDGDFNGPSPAIAAILRRLSESRMQHQSDSRTAKLLREATKAFEASYEVAALPKRGEKATLGRFAGADWEILEALVTRGAPFGTDREPDFRRYTTLVTKIGINDEKTKEEYQQLLEYHPHVIEELCRILQQEPFLYGDATLWLFTMQAERWFDHPHDIVHSSFIESGAASGIARILAFAMTRPPYPGASDVMDRISPLIFLLIKREDWVINLLDAFAKDSIMQLLALGPGLASTESWVTTEATMRDELSRLVSRAGIGLIFSIRFGDSETGGANFPNGDGKGALFPTWSHPDTVAAGRQCIDQCEFGPKDLIQLNGGQKLENVFNRYTEGLRNMKRETEAKSITEGLATWKNKPSPPPVSRPDKRSYSIFDDLQGIKVTAPRGTTTRKGN